MNINSEKFVKILGKGHAQFLSKQIADCFDKESYANVKFICKTATRGESSATQQQCLLLCRQEQPHSACTHPPRHPPASEALTDAGRAPPSATPRRSEPPAGTANRRGERAG